MRRPLPFFILFAVLSLLDNQAAVAQSAPLIAPPVVAKPALEFLPNHGQWPAQVQLRTEAGPGLTIFLENQRLTFFRFDAPAWAAAAHARGHSKSGTPPPAVAGHAWAVELVGARAATRPEPVGEPTGVPRNYFLGSNPKHWATQVRATAAARYPDAWPGIHLLTHASAAGQFEYDFDVRPGADPARIHLRYHGLAGGVTLDARTGRLRLRTALGELQEAAPVAWQPDAAGRPQPVACRFVLTPHGAETDIGFALPAGYDRTRPLLIDPVLMASTYSAATSPTFGHTATYDASGHLYAAGPCFDPGYPTTLGAFDLTHSGPAGGTGSYDNPDVAVSRYSPDGKRLLYATYLGGQRPDYPHSLIVNHQGELLILGSTESANFPTTVGAYDRTANGTGFTSDLFIAKLDSTGAQLRGSTYVGGSADDGRGPGGLHFFYGDTFRGDLAVDSLDRVFVATSTESANFPFTTGAVRPASFATSTAVVLRLNAELTQLDWAAGIGSASAAYGLYLPPSGAPYVVGTTFSFGLPTTPGTLAPAAVGSPNQRQRDGFIAQLSPNGDSIRAATYLRPSVNPNLSTQAFFVQPDPLTRDVYVLQSSTGFYPATAGTWGQARGGLVVQRLSADLRQHRWTATIGQPVTFGSGPQIFDDAPDTDNLSPTAFLVDRCGAVYVSGWGRTQGLTTTPDALQRTTNASGIGGDLYLLVLAPDAASLQYATFLGGSSSTNFYEEHVDGGTSRFDPHGQVYQAVCTNAHNFPTSNLAWSTQNQVGGGAYDEVAFKLDFEPRIVQAAALASSTSGLEAPADIHFTNNSSNYPGTVWQWNFGDGSAPSTVFEPNHTYLQPGTFTVQLITTDPGACGSADTAYVTIEILPNDSTDYLTYTICRGDSVRFAAINAAPGTFRWSPDSTLSSATAPAPVATPSGTTVYVATGRLPGSARSNTWRVTVNVTEPDSVALTIERHCLPGGIQATMRLSQALQNVRWEYGDGSPPETADAGSTSTHFFLHPGTYTVRVSGLDSHGCRLQREALLETDQLFVPNIFTPNADGINETFEIGCLDPGTATLQVYSRWGRLVYDSGANAYANQWDGGGLAAGLYYYYLRLNYTAQPVKGWVEIAR
jgi:gliding motility-associated-like protein